MSSSVTSVCKTPIAGDYIFYRGSIDDPVVQARFDASWQMPEADAAKIDSTSAAVVRNVAPQGG